MGISTEQLPLDSVYKIEGLDCPDCAARLEQKVRLIPGVEEARVIFATATLEVRHSGQEKAIARAVRETGNRLLTGDEKEPGIERENLWTAVSGILLALGMVTGWMGFEVPAGVLLLGSVASGGLRIFKAAWFSLLNRSLDMNILMTVAVTGALIIGEWEEAAAVVFLFSLARFLEWKGLEKTRRSLRSLMEQKPRRALLRTETEEIEVDAASLIPGDVVAIKPGARVPADCVVIRGKSGVDESTFTGESLPVEKGPGDMVLAGSLNLEGYLEGRVEKSSADTLLAKIIELVEEAQKTRAPMEQVVDRFTRWYTPAVLLLAAGVLLVPVVFGGQPLRPWLYRSLVFLVISCPCALVISTPVTVLAGIGSAARRGVLVKGGAYLEAMGRIKVACFDKTGTITGGRPRIVKVLSLDGRREEEVLALAASLEAHSDHPLARAVVEAAADLEVSPVEDFRQQTGEGVAGVIAGKHYTLGRVTERDSRWTEMENEKDCIISVLAEEGRAVGILAARDEVRERVAEVLRRIKRAGIAHTVLLTGDRNESALRTAEGLGFDDIRAGLLPADKQAIIREMRSRGAVAMIGDGINDAPALAAADLGIAMGAGGSDTAIEAADIVLMEDNLERLAFGFELGRRTIRIIKQNIAFSLLVKAVFVILTLAGMSTLWMAVFADDGVALLVILNGLRLFGNREKSIGWKTSLC